MATPTYDIHPNLTMRLNGVILLTGLSRSTIYAAMTNGAFPRPVKLGARAVGWPYSEISAWLESRKAARDAA